MLVQAIDGILIYPSNEPIVISNPTEEQLKSILGFKDEIEGEMPEYNPETQGVRKIFVSEDETSVTTAWEVYDLESEV